MTAPSEKMKQTSDTAKKSAAKTAEKSAVKTAKKSTVKTPKKTAARKQTTAQKTAAVEDALYKRAVGYSADELIFSPDENGEKCIKIVRKEVAPSIQAQIQWLKAYKPEVWKNGSESDPSDPALLYRALTGGNTSEYENDV
jgi:hypothetical protein